jgi:hypothetical protein
MKEKCNYFRQSPVWAGHIITTGFYPVGLKFSNGVNPW